MSKWNGNKFSVYESEEKTVLGLLDELGSYVNHNTDNLKNKTDLYGDHKGSWQGLSRPTLSEEGMRATVEDIIDNKIPSIEYNIDNFPRLNNETNDYDRITRALEIIPQGSILKFNNDKYDLGYKDIEINKRITIKGVFAIKEGNSLYGTFFENGGIVIKSNNVTIEKIGVNCPAMDNAFEGNLTSLQHIKIVDCVGIAKDHSYLFESYRGVVEDITIENCTSYNSEHGFILKCNNSIINNCKAYNHNGYGYGLVADNIPNAEQVANCRYNKIINSYAENCNFGISCYSTDYYSNTNENNVRCSNNNITNININNCTTGIMLGNGSETPSDKRYNSILEFNVTDCNIIKGEKSIFAYDIGRLKYSTIKGGVAECESNVHNEYIFSLDTDINTIDEKNFTTHNIQVLPSGTTPMLNSTSSIYRTNNTEKTTLIHIGHGKEKMLLYILIDENNTTIETTDYIKVNNKYRGKGSYVILKYENEKWYEVVGYCIPNGTHQYYLEDTDLYIDTRNGDCYDIALSRGTSNKIYIDQNIPHSSNILNIIVRSTGGEYTFGGFGDMFVLPSGIDYRVNWNQSLSFQFIKFNGTGKWACVSYFDNIPII